ncbi:MAG: AGE family epimerase/isomerase [Eubacteriales bacterium]
MSDLQNVKKQMEEILSEKIIPFWLQRSIDKEYGGYLTSFDGDGEFDGVDVKYLVTQSRMVWGFANLISFGRSEDKEKMLEAAMQGAKFLIEKFWDQECGGFYWALNRDGSVKDPAKLVYGESFAIYALSEFYLATKEMWALEYAEKTFDLLQKYATDTLYGGYYENLEKSWEVSPSGPYAGERKSLDIHMHLMEAYTTLYLASGKEIHARKLKEVGDLIVNKMINAEKGYGYNQFDNQFNSLPTINILRTWNAERETNEVVSEPLDTTSYGHNVELSWLGDLAFCTLGDIQYEYKNIWKQLLEHSLRFGYDYEYGGVFRDGVADQEPVVMDKEWWQNFESLVGYSHGAVLFEEDKYLDAFYRTWDFVREKFLNLEVGESKQLLDRKGNSLVSNMGNPWKGIYHTGRALAESIKRLDLLIKKEE